MRDATSYLVNVGVAGPFDNIDMITLCVAYGKCNCCLPISHFCKFLSTEEEEMIVISKILPLASPLKASWTWDFRLATALETQLQFYWISYKYVWCCRWLWTFLNLCNLGHQSLSPITVMLAPTIHALDLIDREDIWSSCNARGRIINSLVIQEDEISSLANFIKSNLNSG